MKSLAKVIAFVLLNSVAVEAVYVVNEAGPVDSAGAIGNGLNTTFTDSYSGASTLYSQLSFSGELTEEVVITQAKEAMFRIETASGGFTEITPDPLTEGFIGTVNVNATFGGAFWFQDGDSTSFTAFESVDDSMSLVDAHWDNLTLQFGSAVAPTSIGSFPEGVIEFDTVGSNFSNDLAIFTSDGNFVDSTSIMASSLSPDLSPGSYLAIIGGEATQFDNGIILAEPADGDYVLRADGTPVANGLLSGQQLAIHSFTVVPEPSAFLFLAVCGLIGRARVYAVKASAENS